MKDEYWLTPGDDLAEAVQKLPQNAIVHLAPGTYRVKLFITVPGLQLIGSGAGKTVLVYGDYANKLDEQGREYVTFRTYTAAVVADNVSMYDLSIVNDALHPEIKGQEVALTVYGDNFTMENCTLSSTQDTLFLGPLPPDLIVRYDGFLHDALRQGKPLRQRFENCLIEGTVDFIFGCGDTLLYNCEIRSLVDVRGCGYVAAPAHSAWQRGGICFHSCRFTCEDGVAPGSIYLARPWRDYGIARFEDCTYAAHISPEGFDKWNDTERDKTARFYESPAVPGRVGWINDPKR